LTAKALYGNFIVLEIAPRIFVHYAHLRQGSVAVKAGDHVRRGAVLGRLGVSGSAGTPHLHLHVSDTATFAESQGLPFVFDTFLLAGHGNEGDALDNTSRMQLKAEPERRRNQLPLDGDLIGF
uniref:M23 family metallopeptidase n=1 Tax=Undibacterium sp. TaxID=1914977 RepID=UPI00374DD395